MIRPRRQEGETRIVRRFAFLPTRTDDGYEIWLRFYWQEQRWGTRQISMDGDFVWMWYTTGWFAQNPTAKGGG